MLWVEEEEVWRGDCAGEEREEKRFVIVFMVDKGGREKYWWWIVAFPLFGRFAKTE